MVKIVRSDVAEQLIEKSLEAGSVDPATLEDILNAMARRGTLHGYGRDVEFIVQG